MTNLPRAIFLAFPVVLLAGKAINGICLSSGVPLPNGGGTLYPWSSNGNAVLAPQDDRRDTRTTVRASKQPPSNARFESSPALSRHGSCIVGGPRLKADPVNTHGPNTTPAAASVAAGALGGAGDWRQASARLAGGNLPRSLEPVPDAGAVSDKTGSPALLSAIIAVESGGNPSAVGDGGRAVGVLQIHPIMVEDCNRILGRDEFTLADRLDTERSVAMFEVWRAHYCKDATDERIARCWNGGPRGYLKEATRPYWAKVSKQMEGTR